MPGCSKEAYTADTQTYLSRAAIVAAPGELAKEASSWLISTSKRCSRSAHTAMLPSISHTSATRLASALATVSAIAGRWSGGSVLLRRLGRGRLPRCWASQWQRVCCKGDEWVSGGKEADED